MNRIISIVVLAALLGVGCEKAEDAGRAVAHKTGALVGKGATEFFGGVCDGVKTVTGLGRVRLDCYSKSPQ